MQLMKYPVEFYTFQSKKWGKITLKITVEGTLQMNLVPTLTPGVEPPELKGQRHVPKGFSLFDYPKEVIINLSFSDAKNIVDWHLEEKEEGIVELFRNGNGFNKKILFNWYCPEGKISTGTIFVTSKERDKKNTDNWNTNQFKIPMSLEELDKLVKMLYFYMNNVPILEIFANSKIKWEEEDKNYIEDIIKDTVEDVVEKKLKKLKFDEIVYNSIIDFFKDTGKTELPEKKGKN